MPKIQSDPVVVSAARVQAKNLLQLDIVARKLQTELEVACSQHLKRQTSYGTLSVENKCRLLILQSLAQQHYLPVREVLHAILLQFPPERCRFFKHSIPLAQLLGPQSQRAVSTYVEENYPLGEQRKAWKCDQANLILGVSKKTTSLQITNLKGSYAALIEDSKNHRHARVKLLQKRPFRRNPFK